MDWVQAITDLCKDWAPLVLSIIGVFAAVATLIPAPKEDSNKAYKIFYSVLSWIAMNFGHAKNATTSNTTKNE